MTSNADVWEGIPPELRELVDEVMVASGGSELRRRCRSGLCIDEEQDATDAGELAAEAALCAALRSLVSRLQEAEEERERIVREWRHLKARERAIHDMMFLEDLPVQLLAIPDSEEAVRFPEPESFGELVASFAAWRDIIRQYPTPEDYNRA